VHPPACCVQRARWAPDDEAFGGQQEQSLSRVGGGGEGGRHGTVGNDSCVVHVVAGQVATLWAPRGVAPLVRVEFSIRIGSLSASSTCAVASIGRLGVIALEDFSAKALKGEAGDESPSQQRASSNRQSAAAKQTQKKKENRTRKPSTTRTGRKDKSRGSGHGRRY